MAEASKRSGGKSAPSRPSKANSISLDMPLDWAASLRSGDGSRAKNAPRSIGSGSSIKNRGDGRAGRPVVIYISSDEDDECRILDSDPFLSTAFKNKMSLAGARDGDVQDDDISIINERGEVCLEPCLWIKVRDMDIEILEKQVLRWKGLNLAQLDDYQKVACRDYPHSRHLCANHPFTTTTHDTCCSKCYCYICDVLAPCTNWKGTHGHCHASDQDQKWKGMWRVLRLSSEEDKRKV